MTEPYSVILSDSPWRYNARKRTNTKFGGGAMKHYPTMTVDELVDLYHRLDAAGLVAEDALLFFWSTGPKMKDAIEIMTYLGWEWVSVAFTWRKHSKAGRPLVLPSNYAGSNEEFVLLGRRGRMLKPAVRLIGSSISTYGKMPHSQKPEEVAERISRMYPNERKLEMFARDRSRPGWTYFGNEIEGSNVITLEPEREEVYG